MEFGEYISIKNKITHFDQNDKSCGILCRTCPLYTENNGEKLYCGDFEKIYPDKAEAIVKKWAEEHHGETRKNKFLALFPNAKLEVGGFVKICPLCIDKNHKCNYSCLDCIQEYWLEEIGEEEKLGGN